ncbi:MAG: signal recognition particle-docking protein FtsY [Bacteroidales bacterium]|nr:signal recognition particle-docking protein FtsY [Bacteroidales bacterium]MBQ1882426.1 signal recognition particle-docking protein FtsY [Bacteroidales bacterium]MBQ2482547.1 signal recognition particle-docking protein FtsY [Bacteroidales bacterium]MBQ2492083.1 signal recognition particle-docking protein FtsY [Bacteroidales bacterium]
MGLFSRKKKTDSSLDLGLHKTRRGFFSRIADAIMGKSVVDDQVLESIEEALIGSDVGIDTTSQIMDRLQERVRKEKGVSTDRVMDILKEEISDMLTCSSTNGVPDDEYVDTAFKDSSKVFDFSKKPYVIMVVGVNGVGKTTTIGKIASQLKASGKKVMIGAADTFRAAAVEQLDIWAQRAGVEIVKQKMGADPASVAYDTLNSAVAKGMDVVIIDTAGRLHNKIGLMNELTKIKNVMKKVVSDAPHDVMLVLDGSTGQNALLQAKEFSKATQISSLTVTKLDGSAKGGVVIGIAEQFKVPVKFIGVGEQVGDLKVFSREDFVESLFTKSND